MSASETESQPTSAPPVRFRHIRWVLLVALVSVLAAAVALAQSGSIYILRRSVLSGGGSQAEGSQYRINYSFGQPSTVDNSAGGTYRLRQGYWRGLATPTATPTPTPMPTCAPINPTCKQQRLYGYQPNRYETVRPILDAAASNSLGTTLAPVYPTIRSGRPPQDTEVSPGQPIPHIILRGIAWQEARWKQFADNKDENPDDSSYCTLMSEKVEEGDCGYGIMQVTSCMSYADPYPCDWPHPERIVGELVYNLGQGVFILLEKWNGRSYYYLIADNNHTIPGSWYYAITAYNGWDESNSPNLADPWRPPYYDEAAFPKPFYPYQEIIWSQMAHPKDPTRTQTIVRTCCGD